MMEHVQGANRPTTLRHLLAIAAVLLLAAVLFVGAAGATEGGTATSPTTITDSSYTEWKEGNSGGWFNVTSTVTIEGEINVTGNVSLILESSAKLTVKNINVTYGNNLTIYGTGQLIASISTESTAGYIVAIGNYGNPGNITIVSGTVNATATGAYQSYAIKGKNVVINGGVVNATATGSNPEGIYSDKGKVIITGGVVEATAEGRDDANGIYVYPSTTNSASGIEISGGTVTVMATGGKASGIQVSSFNSLTSPIEISGGIVTATVTTTGSGDNGIGRGIYASSTLTISDSAEVLSTVMTNNAMAISIQAKPIEIKDSAKVTAIATSKNDDAYGIRTEHSSIDIVIQGGTVTATATGTGDTSGIFCQNGDVKISGGTVTTVGTSMGIRAESLITDTNGNAFIIASSIKDGISLDSCSGVIFNDSTTKIGKVYGSPTLSTDALIPTGYTLMIESGKTLTINNGVTLTNNGTITNTGTITGDGTIDTTNGNIDTTSGTISAKVKGIQISATVASVSVSEGDTATFSVTTETPNYNPSPTSSYQWQESQNYGSTWADISGETTAQYQTAATTLSMNGWQYRCKVTVMDDNSAESNAATLTIQSSDATLEHVKISGLAGVIDDSAHTISVVLHHDMSLPTTEDVFDVKPKHEKASYTLTKTADDGSKWKLTVTAEAGNTQDYTVTVTIETATKAENQADVNGVIDHIKHHEWKVYCETANDSDSIKTWIEGQLDNVIGLEGATATVTMGTVQPSSASTAGSFAFAVALTKGEGSDEATGSVTIDNGVITTDPIQYGVSVHAIGSGTVSASPTSAIGGTTITLTATPNSGYAFKAWVVVEGGVTISNNQFTMPEQNVVIHAVFTALPPSPSDDSPSGSSIWLMETTTPTPTETETETPTPTDTAPTQTPDEGGLPLTGIIVGLVVLFAVVGIGVGVYLRKRN